MTSLASKNNDIEKVAEMIKGIRIAMLSTVAHDGTIRSRPMATQNSRFDGVLWFFTNSTGGKIDEIANDQHVNLSYADSDNSKYVSMSGTAMLVRDRAKAEQLWNPFVKAWFPKGLEDPDLALLRVEVSDAEYWDAPSNKMVRLAGLVKAMVTGTQYDSGEHAHVSL